jgi:integrase
MQGNGSRAATAHQAHRTIRTALGEAHRRKRITSNPAAIARPPRIDEGDDEVEPYSVADVQRGYSSRRRSAATAPDGQIALALGLREGETLGLLWTDIDLDRGVLRVRRGRVRPKYEHGCGGACNRKHAGYCPDRRQVRPTVASTKSKAGRRSIGLPDQLVELLRVHKRQQDAERAKARQLWEDGGWVFASETRHGSAAARRTRASGDGDHGLVDNRHGCQVPAHHRGCPSGHRESDWRAALGGS